MWVVGTTTFRGCESEIPEGTLNYKICTLNGCNQFIFPEERIKCVKCSVEDDFCITPNADLLYPCKNYVEDDSCYTYVVNGTSAVRGCLSDLDSNVNLCRLVGERCIKCSEEFCNLQTMSYVSCSVCSSVNDDSCGYTRENSADSKLCEQLLGRDNLCFAYGNQSHFFRGCLNDYPELKQTCEQNSENCQTCDEDGCNTMKIIEELCYICDSLSDPNCETVSTTLTPTLCGEGTINKSGCYLSEKGKSSTNS